MDLFLSIPVAQRCIKFENVILVVRNEKRYIRVCNQVFGLPKSKGKASSSFGIITVYQNTGVEMGPNYHGIL